MISITRLLEFDAGHRVLNHEGKCHTLHGHRYKVEVEATSKYLDPLGRVIDFSEVKMRLGSWLDENWDHTCVFYEKDQEALDAFHSMSGRKDCYLLPVNPTAENMAHYLLNKICPKLFKDSEVQIIKITIWETPNCRAECST